MFTNIVKFKDKCWLQAFSIDDEIKPIPKGMTRMKMHDLIIYFKPEPEI